MLVYNKYMKELGIGKHDYPLGTIRQKLFDKRFRKNKDGVVVAQLWDLNYVLDIENYCALRAFRENPNRMGYPGSLGSDDEWNQILDEMALFYKLGVYTDGYYFSLDPKIEKEFNIHSQEELDKKVKELKETVDKYYRNLWD